MCVSAICSCKAESYLTMNEILVRQVNDSERFDEVKYEGESVAHPGKVNSEWFAPSFSNQQMFSKLCNQVKGSNMLRDLDY